MSYHFGTGKTRPKNVGSIILIFSPQPEKAGLARGATKILNEYQFGVSDKWAPYLGSLEPLGLRCCVCGVLWLGVVGWGS